ncbi:DNA adenine methylase [Longimicrobium terrae]|uniref:site-specific DNA-methyltransferase (adenine-specific) n=1 Tax=Longimicrobium terrae TaxID=1639882 RepID=A0A841GPP6_9BACT|nr:DNA adenine methylase [Longimicrobium terrae]MBB4634958.1 DNA adenine methylase/adenine-specific DNA-methyltransferase [Longimicrobium terrae]MBB6069352.1 DNA adenine methylase/adenine-specific DNA-methyltransferase [Longimicrobium terrae]NNC31839.1 DNA methyltransferase [Longimicrobium terrae]
MVPTLQLDLGIAERALPRSRAYPRLRYMGSKYKVIPHLSRIFSRLEFSRALDAFSGSGVVGYALKEMGVEVVTNDFLSFPSTVARALVENQEATLNPADIASLLAPNADGRDFIQRTFNGLYFPAEDHAFLDSVWSHLHTLPPYKRAVAISALCLAAARKQPRGVFTVTDFRYDDGRKSLRTPLREQFVTAVADYNSAVFDNGKRNQARCGDVFDLDPDGFDLVYLDPPYAPPKDDNDYIKRYHFLEGLSVYWEGQTIMQHTATKKIEKKHTPFGSKRTIREALRATFNHFRRGTLVLSYSSNSVPGPDEIMSLLRAEKAHVDVYSIPHTYSFGTHAAAQRRSVDEYIFVAR